MIYLRFPSSPNDMVECAEIKKPNYSAVLETALNEWYTESLAKRFADSLAENLYEAMDFPQDGIYYINPETNTFFCFSKATRKWTDTQKTSNDYIIDSTNNIWDTLFSLCPYLKNVSEHIKSVIKEQTQKMFDVENWSNIYSCDLKTYFTSIQNQVNPWTVFLSEYFSKKAANNIYNDVMKILFPNFSNNTILILNNGVLYGMLSSKYFTHFDELNFNELEDYFSKWLEKAEMPDFMKRLKNLLCFGLPYDSIINSEQGTAYYMQKKELKLVTYDREHFYAESIPFAVQNLIEKKCSFERDRYGHLRIIPENEIIIEEYGIKIPVKHEDRRLDLPTEHFCDVAYIRQDKDGIRISISDGIKKEKNIEVQIIY